MVYAYLFLRENKFNLKYHLSVSFQALSFYLDYEKHSLTEDTKIKLNEELDRLTKKVHGLTEHKFLEKELMLEPKDLISIEVFEINNIIELLKLIKSDIKLNSIMDINSRYYESEALILSVNFLLSFFQSLVLILYPNFELNLKSTAEFLYEFIFSIIDFDNFSIEDLELLSNLDANTALDEVIEKLKSIFNTDITTADSTIELWRQNYKNDSVKWGKIK